MSKNVSPEEAHLLKINPLKKIFMINELAQKVHQNAKDKGFYEKEKNIGEMLSLIHAEVSEALEADRKDNYATGQQLAFPTANYDDAHFKRHYEAWIKGSFEEEMADIVIRVLDMCAFKKIDLERHIEAKIRYNTLRQKYHGKKY